MNDFWCIYGTAVTILFLIFFVLYLMHKRQIYTLNRKIDFIKKCTTNISLTADFSSKDIYELVNAINDLLQEYQKSVRDARKKNQAVKETITNLAHDLRTPLTAIYGYSQILLNSPNLKEQDVENVSIILERVNALNVLLNQLFEFARLESGEIVFTNTKINLNAILRKTIVSFYQQFEEKELVPEIEISEGVFDFYGDENAVTRVFTNVIHNALIHGRDNYIFGSKMAGDNYEFYFKNRTEDMSVQDVNQIFERFYTTDKSRTKKTTGLGLSIAKKIVMGMGGTIEAELEEKMFSIVIKFPVRQGWKGAEI